MRQERRERGTVEIEEEPGSTIIPWSIEHAAIRPERLAVDDTFDHGERPATAALNRLWYPPWWCCMSPLIAADIILFPLGGRRHQFPEMGRTGDLDKRSIGLT